MNKDILNRSVLASIIVNINTFSSGLTVGWMSPATVALQSSSAEIGNKDPLTDSTIKNMGSVYFLGNFVSAVLWIFIVDKISRKSAGYLSAFPTTVGWILILFGPNHLFLLAGRFLMGTNMAGAAILVSLYVGEISEDSSRGTTGSFMVLFFNFGLTTAYVVGATFSLRASIVFGCSVSILSIVLFFFMPESPVYLWTVDKKAEARKSLLWLRSGDDVKVEKEMLLLDTILSLKKSQKRTPIRKLFETKANSKAMIISLLLYSSFNFNGRAVLMTYMTEILIASQLKFNSDMATAIVGAIIPFACLVTTYFIDRSGRKSLSIVSNSGTALSLLIVAAYFYFQDDTEFIPTWIPFTCLCFNSLFSSIFNALPSVISVEILQPSIRPAALPLLVLWASLNAYIVVQLYIILLDIIYLSGIFLFFASFSIFVILITIFYIPETRGKSIVEIQDSL